jgi:hypothetical protein
MRWKPAHSSRTRLSRYAWRGHSTRLLKNCFLSPAVFRRRICARSEPSCCLVSATVQEGQAVQLCRVEKRLIASIPSPVPWCFPVTDAVVAGKPGRQGKTRVQIFQAEDDFTNRILVAGCDPGISVLSRHVQAAGIELVLAHRNSSQALAETSLASEQH